MTAVSATLQAFFTDPLIRQRHASPHTLAAYRDTLRLMLVFAAARHGTNLPSWSSTTSMPRVSATSSTTSKIIGATARGPRMRGLPLSDRCSDSPLFVTRARRDDRTGARDSAEAL